MTPNQQREKRMGSQKGVALILAMFTIVLVSYLATELAYETNVEYIINSQAVQGVKAYYAAKAGIQLSLLRIKIYTQVATQLPPAAKQMIKQDLIDKLWKMPFAWPPPIPKDANLVDKDLLNEKIKDSIMDATYTVTIEDEGSKIDVNDLGSPSQAIRDVTKKRLLEIFESKKRTDSKWAQTHQDLKYDEIINNIQDWVTPTQQSVNGGNKMQKYASLGEGFPPNRAFRTLEELHLVPEMTDDAFEVMKDQITVYGMRAINPNNVDKETFMAFDPAITSTIADELVARRSDTSKGGPYQSAKDFWQAVANYGAQLSPQLIDSIPIVTDQAMNFRIKSVGNYLKSTREITAIVFDTTRTATQVAAAIQSAQNSGAGGGTNPNSSTTPNTPNKAQTSKGPPRILYWKER